MTDDDNTINRLFTDRSASEARKDTLIGEMVRILVRADTASFAKLYAAAKAEEAIMNAQMQDFFRGRAKPDDDPAPPKGERPSR